MSDTNTIDQQRRVINQIKNVVQNVVDSLNSAQVAINTYSRLGLEDEGVLTEGAFGGTGTDIATFRDAVSSLQALTDLLDAGHGTNLERLVR